MRIAGATIPDGKRAEIALTYVYGIGLARTLATIVEIYHDENGIIWPEAVAPFRVHLIELGGKGGDREKVKNAAQTLYRELLAKEVEVLYDDRDGKSAGEKFADADLIGIPWRVGVSEKTLAKDWVELKKRDSQESEFISQKELFQRIENRD